MSNDNWNNNLVQFARLLCEVNAVVHIQPEDFEALADSMDLSHDEVLGMFDRAHKVWEAAKKAPGAYPYINSETAVQRLRDAAANYKDPLVVVDLMRISGMVWQCCCGAGAFEAEDTCNECGGCKKGDDCSCGEKL